MKKGGVNREIMDNFVGQYSKYKLDPYNIEKEKANLRLHTARDERTRKDNPKNVMIDHLLLDEKTINFEKENNFKLVEYLSHDPKNLSSSPKFLLPETKEGLWVVRPIGKHVI